MAGRSVLLFNRGIAARDVVRAASPRWVRRDTRLPVISPYFPGLPKAPAILAKPKCELVHHHSDIKRLKKKKSVGARRTIRPAQYQSRSIASDCQFLRRGVK
jgi:hypothetical protein